MYRTVSALGERGIIREIIGGMHSIKKQFPLSDDCQYLQFDDGMIISTDRTPTDLRPFEFGVMSYHEYGRYHAYSNISDVISSGGVPKYYLLNLGLPKDMQIVHLEEFISGVDHELLKYDMALVGGDTKESTNFNAVGIAIGEPYKKGAYVSRSNARAGDSIYIDSRPQGLGLCPASQHIFKKYSNNELRLDGCTPLEIAILEENVATMGPCLTTLKRVLDTEVLSACADNSDGIFSTCSEIAKSSNVKIEISIPEHLLNENVLEYTKLNDLKPEILCLGAGGDFRLVATGSEDIKAGNQFICIGKVLTEGEPFGSVNILGTKKIPSSWEHFTN